MEIHIFYNGARALASIEYMKIIVEKIRRIVIKILLTTFILAVSCDTLRALKTNSYELPETIFF